MSYRIVAAGKPADTIASLKSQAAGLTFLGDRCQKIIDAQIGVLDVATQGLEGVNVNAQLYGHVNESGAGTECTLNFYVAQADVEAPPASESAPATGDAPAETSEPTPSEPEQSSST